MADFLIYGGLFLILIWAVAGGLNNIRKELSELKELLKQRLR